MRDRAPDQRLIEMGERLNGPIRIPAHIETQVAKQARDRVIRTLKKARAAVTQMPPETQLVFFATITQLLESLVMLGALPGEESAKIFAREIRKIIPGIKKIREIIRAVEARPKPRSRRVRTRH